jgi:long-chain acyl-CoA synthetase
MYELSRFTLDELALRGAKHYADETFVGCVTGYDVSYREALEVEMEAALRLAKEGLAKGERVAILSENMAEWPLSYFAIALAGCVSVPILVDFSPEQIARIVAHAEIRFAFASAKYSSKLPPEVKVLPIEDLGKKAREAYASKAALEEGRKKPKKAQAKAPLDRASAELPSALAARAPAEDDLAVIVYTSGTTGHSKGVMLSHRNIVWDAWATRSIIAQHPGDVLLSVLPLAHTYECTIGMITAAMQGAQVRYLDKPPSASALMPALKKWRPTIMLTVPLLIEKIYRSSIKPKLESMGLYKVKAFKPFLERLAGKSLMRSFGGRIRFFGVGGAPLDPEVEGFLGRAGFPYSIGYGLTETAPLIAGAGPFKTFLRSTGPALQGVELTLLDPHVDPATGDTVGEIAAKGPNVFLGYYKDPERTAECFTPDGRFRTGDLGCIDETARVFVRGRLKTMILGPTGENIYPEEIESVLNAHELVLESMVYEDDDRSIVAAVRIRPEIMEKFENGMESIEHAVGPLLERLKKEANSKLANFSKLGRVIFRKEEFEKTPTMKLKRGKGAQPGDGGGAKV